ncbi:AMP-binding protein [Marinifilum fragile]|uniref:AMP-binding protein n=1 Tax=Marinifilum fragile TaxID=570161 RepID=UPI002AA6EC4A|nr:AMP-binding protein [Marinifilum fragile]
MLFDLDLKPSDTLAAIDDQGHQITYGKLVENCNSFKTIIPERELVFCLCDNSVGSLLGYISFYENRDVSLLLGASIDKDLLSQLISIYQPSYLWLPEKYLNEFQLEVIVKQFDFVLVKTNYDSCQMHEDLSLLITTSGSTGSPKLVRHKYGNIETNAKTIAKVFGWTKDEKAICILPIQYSMGLNVINSHLYSGGTVLLVSNNMTSPAFWNFIKENKGTSFTGVPFSYEILHKLRFMRMDLPYLTTLAEGGGKLSDSTFAAFADFAEQSSKRFFATFGTTETSARMSYLPPILATEKTGSIGKPIPGSEMFLIDDENKVINEPNVEGELCYRGPNVTMGYAICREDLNLGEEFNGEYKTGDIAKRDDEGFYYIIGRKKRFLKLFGLRISLDQCETLITEKFNIECACAGDDKKMEIYITEEPLKSEIKEFISQKTGLMTNLFNVNIIEYIPRNSSGKVNYRTLQL